MAVGQGEEVVGFEDVGFGRERDKAGIVELVADEDGRCRCASCDCGFGRGLGGNGRFYFHYLSLV